MMEAFVLPCNDGTMEKPEEGEKNPPLFLQGGHGQYHSDNACLTKSYIEKL